MNIALLAPEPADVAARAKSIVHDVTSAMPPGGLSSVDAIGAVLGILSVRLAIVELTLERLLANPATIPDALPAPTAPSPSTPRPSVPEGHST